MTVYERHILPNRRLMETRKVRTPEGPIVHLSVGYDPDDPTMPYEVFYSQGLKTGSDLEYHMQDMCVLISLLLQRGMKPDEIGHSLSRVERPKGDVTFAMLTGFIVTEIAQPPMWQEEAADLEEAARSADATDNDASPELPHSEGDAL